MQVIGDGTQARDFGFVRDIVEGIVVTATRAPGKGEALNVASGRTHTIAELAEAIGRVCGATPAIAYTGRVRPGDSQRWVADISALRALGYEPRYALDDGLAAVRDWYDNGLR
jgi:nucleoside-diphosphate-sugar epimerase